MAGNPGKHLLLTRPKAQSVAFRDMLHASFGEKATITIAPLVEIKDVPVDVEFAGLEALIFTSANAVSRAVDLTKRRDLKAFCVGEATAQAAKTAGFPVEIAGGDGQALLETLDGISGPVLHLHGADLAVDIVAALRAKGVIARGEVVYRQVSRPFDNAALDILRSGQPVAVPLFSRKIAAHFSDEIERLDLPLPTVICLSEPVAQALGRPWPDTLTAKSPNRAELTREIAAWLDRPG